MTQVSISSSVRELSGDTFGYCVALKSITVDSNNPYMTSLDGVLMTKDMKKIIKCPSEKTSFIIPDGVTTVGYDAFKESRIKEFIFPVSTSIVENGGLYGSYNCSIIFNGHLSSFGNQSFSSQVTITVKSESDKQLILDGQDSDSDITGDNIIVKP